MAIIFHITTSEEWKQALENKFYEAPSLKTEGFIHCSLPEQVDGVLKRYFNGKTNLVKLEINTDKLTSPFYFEWSPTIADTFPHIYGPINLEAVTSVEALER